jgi:hypothetical protein
MMTHGCWIHRKPVGCVSVRFPEETVEDFQGRIQTALESDEADSEVREPLVRLANAAGVAVPEGRDVEEPDDQGELAQRPVLCPSSAAGVQAESGVAKYLKVHRKMVEAAGIENVSTLMKLGTYSRNRCLKSASGTFASCWNTSHEHPPGSKQTRRGSV